MRNTFLIKIRNITTKTYVNKNCLLDKLDMYEYFKLSKKKKNNLYKKIEKELNSNTNKINSLLIQEDKSEKQILELKKQVEYLKNENAELKIDNYELQRGIYS